MADVFTLVGASCLLIGAVVQATAAIRSMNSHDVALFRAHTELEEEHVARRRAEVYRARWLRRRRLAKIARREVQGALLPEELDRLKAINLSFLGWSLLIVGSVAAMVAALTA